MNKDIVLFDATCRLCNNAVRLITRNDRKRRFCFAALDSEEAAEYLRQYKGNPGEKGTMMLIANGRIYMKSDAVLMILKHMDGLWPILYGFIIFPRIIRDPVYELVSKYRYKLFGPCIDCPEPRPC